MINKDSLRTEKISFIKDLLSGKKSLMNALPLTTEIWITTAGKNEHLFTNESTGKVLTDEMLTLRQSRNSNLIIWKEIKTYN